MSNLEKSPNLADEYPLRDVHRGDLDQVLMIERNAQIMPWSRLSFEESITKQHLVRVLESNNKIAAFYVICPVADEMHILNLAVAPQLQGNGFAHCLMHDIVEQCNTRQIKKIFLEVRASNQVAQSLYQQWQFRQIDLRKSYYRTADKQREDALVLLKEC